MGKKVLFVNVSKNTRIFVHQTAEAERYGHTIYNLTDFYRPVHKTLKHIEYVDNIGELYVKKIKEMYDRLEIDYIMTQCEVLYPLLDHLAEQGYSMIPVMGTPAENIVNKERFGLMCNQIGIPGPDFFTPLTIESFANYDKPIFVKPTNGTDGTIKMHKSEDKYAYFDYCRFDSVQKFLESLQSNDYVETFLKTQRELSNMPHGKGIRGIKGRHIIQECIPSDLYFFFNLMITEGKIKFLMLSRTKHKHKPNLYYLDDSITEVLTLEKNENNYAKVKDWLGKDVFEPFMEQMSKVIEHAKIDLAVLDVSFIPFRDTWCLQDMQLRHGGVVSRIIKANKDDKKDKFFDKIYFDDIKYDTIWEYI